MAAEVERERVARKSAQAEAARRYDFDAFLDRYIVSHVRREDLRSLADIEGTFDRDVRPTS